MPKTHGGHYMEFDLSKIHIASYVKYRATFLSAGVVHIFFLIFFLCIGQYFMAAFNVFSVLLYVIGAFRSVPKDSETIKYGWIVAFYVEIMIHATLCSILMGWDTGFYLYSIAVLPIAAYLLFLTASMKKFMITMLVMTAMVALLMGGCMVYLGIFGSLEELEPLYLIIISYFNAFFAGTVILVFTMLFVLEVATMLRKIDAANKQLEFIATHDALTGLYNRHSLKKLFHELEQSEKPYCIIMGDIDDFKKVNDTYGHDCGDTVLKSVAEVITHNIGENDTACRWGGEEMLIVMWGEQESCFNAVSVIKDKINALRISSKDKQVAVSMTFGFVNRSEEPNGIEALIAVADDRLYIGKRSGKNVIITENKNS